MSKVYTKKN